MIVKSLKGVSYETIREWYLEKGIPTSKIADGLGCSRQRVAQVLRLQGVNVSKVGQGIRAKNIQFRQLNRQAGLPQNAHAEARRLKEATVNYQEMRTWWDDGKSFAEIAELSGKNVGAIREAIYRLRRKYGWFEVK